PHLRAPPGGSPAAGPGRPAPLLHGHQPELPPDVGRLARHPGRSGSSGGHPPASPAAAAGKLTVIWPELAIYARSGHMTVDFTKLLPRTGLFLGRPLGRPLLGRSLGPLLGDQLIGPLSGQALHRIGLAQGGVGGSVGDIGPEAAVLDHYLLARDRVL